MRIRWTLYLHLLDSSAAFVLRSVGGKGPADARRRIEASFSRGEIDRDSYDTRLDMLNDLRSRWMDFHYEPVNHDVSDWEPMHKGGYRRKNHIEENE